ncbi:MULTISPECIES: DEAD/DEAH box helicase [unclassified Sulfitobacter]|uniref:DEAD/DEAH box helicase n=1 Tax=unclassified Sulfitobacter TaxID=196795 RepID=UPI003744B2A3
MNLEELQELVAGAIEPGYRGSLLARGQARAMIWRDGELPEGAPAFIPTLSYDLLSYGHSLLLLSMHLREEGGDEALMRSAFERAGEAIEAVVSKGRPDDPRRGFFRLLAAAAFHLARLTARAFSLLHETIDDANLSKMERGLALLILRALDDLEGDIFEWRLSGLGSDEALIEGLNQLEQASEIDQDADPLSDAIDRALLDVFFGGLGAFLLALETGEPALVEQARDELTIGLEGAGASNMVPQWWCFRLTIHLLDDLWDSSFHEILPPDVPGEDNEAWGELRSLLISSLFRRKRSEIELWPSQLEGACRSIDTTDNLVVSLPTSAGKTRIAELCILRCLAQGKRVVFVTPLRALSAQTEASLRKTFGPLGKTISALYGSMGTSGFEEDALKSRHIVVATPEKLDFALRNDPAILDDVGLVVLDEGHMIGLGEREVRYELQIQRLLKRPDADQRRIVCLSAILPEGDQFDDFVGWLRCDQDGDAVSVDWRPTRIRFGEVLWRTNRARLELRVGEEKPFVPTFFGQRYPTSGQRTVPFPRDQRELVLATAWRLVEDGQSVLIYCPMRRSVEPFAKAIVDLAQRGFLQSVLTADQEVLASAMSIGQEWLGQDHPILKCLSLGIAIHHGALPTPFRKEMERLLRDGVLKITVSSPTLAQGLNLTATAVVIHSLHRSGEIIPASEFKNVIGRAGRAFIDVEGQVLFPIFNNHDYRRNQWETLIGQASKHSLESGLLRLVVTLIVRLSKALDLTDSDDLLEYIVNNAAAWDFPEIAGEDENQREAESQDWERYITILDTALLSLLGDQELDAAEISVQLDDVLQSSLWHRRLQHQNENIQSLLTGALKARANAIWEQSTAPQRRGYFLAGVGLRTGQMLDAAAGNANDLLVAANSHINDGEAEDAIAAITGLAEIIFGIDPFVPDPFPDNWKDILEAWLKGLPLAEFNAGNAADALRFVENGLIYKLPWGIEAVRVRAEANGDTFDDDGLFTIDDFEVGLAVPAIETGTLNLSAATLMQAGFTSRLAAIKAVEDTQATFLNSHELKGWLDSELVQALSKDENWPTSESRSLWEEFTREYIPLERSIWKSQSNIFPIELFDPEKDYLEGASVRLLKKDEDVILLSATMSAIGRLKGSLTRAPKGVMVAKMGSDANTLIVRYFGPEPLAELFI